MSEAQVLALGFMAVLGGAGSVIMSNYERPRLAIATAIIFCGPGVAMLWIKGVFG